MSQQIGHHQPRQVTTTFGTKGISAGAEIVSRHTYPSTITDWWLGTVLVLVEKEMKCPTVSSISVVEVEWNDVT
jgi:hypothetical protein